MTYFNGMLYRALPFYKRNALVEGSTHFKEMHHSFSRESFKVFEHVLIQGFEPRMSISKISSTHSLVAYVVAILF
jgi:hypothetical protein